MNHSRLLSLPQCHPSPPTVIALSCNTRILLSASLHPPTVYITFLALNVSPILLQRHNFNSAVVAAGFHPEKEDLFLLASADGTCTLFDAARLFKNENQKQALAETGFVAELASVKNIHANCNVSSGSELYNGSSFRKTGNSSPIVGDKSLGIVAMGFILGTLTKVVTVGADGKCCVINFVLPDNKDANIEHSWYIQGPATSLAVIRTTSYDNNRSLRAKSKVSNYGSANIEAVIAVGRQDGTVLLFNIRGHPLEGRKFDSEGLRIIDIDWVSSGQNSSTDMIRLNDKTSPSLISKSRRKSLGSVLAGGRPISEDVVSVLEDAGEEPVVSLHGLSAGTGPPKRLEETRHNDLRTLHQIDKSATENLFSQDKIVPPSCTSPDQGEGKMKRSLQRETNSLTPLALKDGLEKAISDYPPVLPLQSSRESRKTSQASTLQAVNLDFKPYPLQISHKSRSFTSKRKGKNPGVYRRNMTAKPVRMSKVSDPQISVIKPVTVPPSHDWSSKVINPSEGKNTIDSPSQNGSLWVDINPLATKPGTEQASANREPSRSRPQRFSVNYKEVHASEVSDDTIIDWSPAATRPIFSSPLAPGPLPAIPPRPSRDPPLVNENETIPVQDVDEATQWSLFKKRSNRFEIPADHSDRSQHHVPSNTSAEYSPKTKSATDHLLSEVPPGPQQAPSSPPLPSATDAPITISDEKAIVSPCQSPHCKSMRSLLRNEMHTLRAETKEQFREQREWFEEKLNTFTRTG